MSLYDEAAAPAPAGEGELVVPDYTAPAAGSSGPTAMGSDGSTGPPVAKSGLVRLFVEAVLIAPQQLTLRWFLPQAQFYLITVPPNPMATDKRKAAELADLQTILYNISVGMCIVTAFHSVMAMTVLDESVGDWLVVAYIITSIGAMGYFGAKHCDKHLLLAFTVSCALWFLFMGVTNLETIGTYFFNCDDEDLRSATADQTKCHRTEAERELCDADPMCDTSKVHFDQKYPFAEVLPDFVLTVLLGLGLYFGFKLYSAPYADTYARQIVL